MSASRTEQPDTGARRAPVAPRTPVYESKALLGGSKEMLISHAGETYRLRVTRQNKLILTK